MQTPAERHLVSRLVRLLQPEGDRPQPARILNVGAGKSVSIERQLLDAGCRFVCDRVDVADCRVVHEAAGECWQFPMESMSDVPQGAYRAAFANYVLEHVADLEAACREVYRVLAPGGLFVATVPNTTAPEFVISRWTPLWFHKMVRAKEAWPTQYAYDGIPDLVEALRRKGFEEPERRQWSFVEGYLGDVPIVGGLARCHDRLVMRLGWLRWMGNACVVVRKPEGASAIRQAPAGSGS